MFFEPADRGIVRFGEATTEALLVAAVGSWAVNLPGASSGAIGVVRRHIVTIRSLEDPSLLISLPVEDESVSAALSNLAAVGSGSHPIAAVREACAPVLANLAPIFGLIDFPDRLAEVDCRSRQL